MEVFTRAADASKGIDGVVPLMPLKRSVKLPESDGEPASTVATDIVELSPPRLLAKVRGSTGRAYTGYAPGFDKNVIAHEYSSRSVGPVRRTSTVPMLGKLSSSALTVVSAALKSMSAVVWPRDVAALRSRLFTIRVHEDCRAIPTDVHVDSWHEQLLDVAVDTVGLKRDDPDLLVAVGQAGGLRDANAAGRDRVEVVKLRLDVRRGRGDADRLRPRSAKGQDKGAAQQRRPGDRLNDVDKAVAFQKVHARNEIRQVGVLRRDVVEDDGEDVPAAGLTCDAGARHCDGREGTIGGVTVDRLSLRLRAWETVGQLGVDQLDFAVEVREQGICVAPCHGCHGLLRWRRCHGDQDLLDFIDEFLRRVLDAVGIYRKPSVVARRLESRLDPGGIYRLDQYILRRRRRLRPRDGVVRRRETRRPKPDAVLRKDANEVLHAFRKARERVGRDGVVGQDGGADGLSAQAPEGRRDALDALVDVAHRHGTVEVGTVDREEGHVPETRRERDPPRVAVVLIGPKPLHHDAVERREAIQLILKRLRRRVVRDVAGRKARVRQREEATDLLRSTGLDHRDGDGVLPDGHGAGVHARTVLSHLHRRYWRPGVGEERHRPRAGLGRGVEGAGVDFHQTDVAELLQFGLDDVHISVDRRRHRQGIGTDRGTACGAIRLAKAGVRGADGKERDVAGGGEGYGPLAALRARLVHAVGDVDAREGREGLQLRLNGRRWVGAIADVRIGHNGVGGGAVVVKLKRRQWRHGVVTPGARGVDGGRRDNLLLLRHSSAIGAAPLDGNGAGLLGVELQLDARGADQWPRGSGGDRLHRPKRSISDSRERDANHLSRALGRRQGVVVLHEGHDVSFVAAQERHRPGVAALPVRSLSRYVQRASASRHHRLERRLHDSRACIVSDVCRRRPAVA
eukprot:scaffold1102_cov256-Pinguiococcus_pyrenoidosus.AAC.40